MSSDDLFYGTRGLRDAKIMVVGESWGGREAELKKPFVGGSGEEQDRILQECGIEPHSVFFTNVISEQPPGNDMWRFFYKTDEARREGRPCIRGLYPRQNVIAGIERLERQIAAVAPLLIIGYGNYTLWALTDNSFSIKDGKGGDAPVGYKVPRGIGWWRGSQLYTRTDPPLPLLPTYHPAAALRNWPWRYLIKHDIAARAKKALNSDWEPPPYVFEVRPSFARVVAFLDNLLLRADSETVWLAEDIETRKGHIACIGFALDSRYALCVPVMCTENEQGYWREEEEFHIVNLIRKLNTHSNVYIIGQNFLYDAQYMAYYWQHVPRIAFDTRVMQHLLYPGAEQSLNYISSMYCDYHQYWKDEGKEWTPKVPEEQLWQYNCRDCVTTFEAKQAIEELVAFYGLEEQASIQMRQVNMILRIMLRGVLVNDRRRAELAGDLIVAAESYGDIFEQMLPRDVYPRKKKAVPWYRSTPQQKEIFYEILGQPVVKDRKTRRVSVGDESLEALATREPILRPLTRKLQEFRSLRTFSQFVTSQLDPDGRMRCEYSPTLDTFRWRSAKNVFGRGGNLANIPKGTEED